mmetsp:Transcript_1086/g.1651  ORF Transcript_1086/g.1651 Transcript_1086/m.1651 type:complete len:140 (-) Transcript_1086:591-1010(-)
MFNRAILLSLLLASASAFAPTSTFGVRTSSVVMFSDRQDGWVPGKYNDKLFDNDAKKDVYNAWDPSKPRSSNNFNPFETYKGNTPDASGIYPGEPRYKDPQRGAASFAIMMAERAEAEQRAANPKAGDAPGAPGCKNEK